MIDSNWFFADYTQHVYETSLFWKIMSVLQIESKFMGRVGFVLLKLYVILLHDILEASLQKVIRVHFLYFVTY